MRMQPRQMIEKQSGELTKLHEKVRDQTIALDVAENAKQHVEVEVTQITAEVKKLRDSLEESKSTSSGHSRELESRLRESDWLRQLEVSQCAAQVDRLQIESNRLRDELAETRSKLREQEKHAEERLTGATSPIHRATPCELRRAHSGYADGAE
jgi:chromosome segregation ATPase